MIIHADMDAFFASVEIREQPALSGKPVVVGGHAESRGVVAAASYAARQFGIRSAMPMATAQKRCPDLIVLPTRISLYSEVSRQIHSIFARYTPLIEPLSLDEAFLDVSASTALFGSAEQIARDIQQTISNELQLIVSIGVAPNKFVAKIASDLRKPNGFVVVNTNQVQDFLDPLPVTRLWGVGKVMATKLYSLKIQSIADLRHTDEQRLLKELGQQGRHLWQLAHGQDSRPVVPEHAAKSVSHETTFANDVEDSDILRAALSELTEQVAWRIRKKDLYGRTVHLKLRFDDFHTITRAHSLDVPTHSTSKLWQTALQLLNKEMAGGLPPIRLIGMGVSGFVNEENENELIQLSIFSEPTSIENDRGSYEMDKLSDDINSRFGNKILTRARGLGSSRHNNH